MYRTCCSIWRWSRIGACGYRLSKKNCAQSLTSSLVRRPGVGARLEDVGGHAMPFILFWTLADKLVCLCVSRNSLITLAREPLGPFFCGIALYVHDSWADEQLRQGLIPSHLTLRRWQASQALFTACDMAACDCVVMVSRSCVDEDVMRVSSAT